MAKDIRKSHINGLPIVLESMLTHLLTISDLKSWSMYQNKDGLVSLNIRFSNILDDNVDIIDMPVSYRKVPAKQLMRSRQRALDHTKPTDTHSTPIHNNTHNNPTPFITNTIVDTGHDNVANVTKKRRLDNLTPELLRRSTRKDSAQDLFIDTPCNIKKSCEHESPDIGLSPESLHDFFPSVPSPAYGPLPVFTTATECEQLDNILPLTTFAVSEKVVEPQEYFSVIVNPETTIEEILLNVISNHLYQIFKSLK